MSTESLAEIIESAGEMKTKKEKIAYLLEKNSKPLRNILKVTYDKSMELNIPSSAPPYVPSECRIRMGCCLEKHENFLTSLRVLTVIIFTLFVEKRCLFRYWKQ
jgi:hypothetical protein